MNALVPTASATAGLIGGYSLARITGVRAVGGIGLAAGGAAAFCGWKANRGAGVAAALTGVYLGAFGYSHALAKKIGAWPSVLTVTGATAAASLAFGGPKK
ncbi:hypothetical protein [Rothia aerolata]|uniref:Uncharacterized protein n=1 Tax=Rothia aerolata TaxID=1812262 RepID=A0A917IWB9_9MICC|nr:hypothetical protein [Rothia aerolata]GGH63554.1 hypothetical protein GCM10007359_14960 [Rothia aerolata]